MPAFAEAIKRRSDLKLIVTSATLDAEKFYTCFFGYPIFYHPWSYIPRGNSKHQKAGVGLSRCVTHHNHANTLFGDILLFPRGQEEIDTSCDILFDRMKALGPEVPKSIILPIYSALPSEVQSRVFQPTPPGARKKVVIATNVAETTNRALGRDYGESAKHSEVGHVNELCFRLIADCLPLKHLRQTQDPETVVTDALGLAKTCCLRLRLGVTADVLTGLASSCQCVMLCGYSPDSLELPSLVLLPPFIVIVDIALLLVIGQTRMMRVWTQSVSAGPDDKEPNYFRSVYLTRLLAKTLLFSRRRSYCQCAIVYSLNKI